MSILSKMDDSKYILAAAAIISSLSKDNLLSDLSKCFPDLFKNDILQLIITASSMFIFVRDAKISLVSTLALYFLLHIIYIFTGKEECGRPIL